MWKASAKFIEGNAEWTTVIYSSYPTKEEALSAGYKFWEKYLNSGCQYIWIEQV